MAVFESLREDLSEDNVYNVIRDEIKSQRYSSTFTTG